MSCRGDERMQGDWRRWGGHPGHCQPGDWYRWHQRQDPQEQWGGASQQDQALHKEVLKRGLMKRTQKYQPGMVALHEICQYQMSTELLIHKCSFSHLIHKITQECGMFDLCFQVCVVMVLQEVAEFYLTGLLEDVNLWAIHVACITIMAKDIQLACHIHGKNLHYWVCIFITKSVLGLFLLVVGGQGPSINTSTGEVKVILGSKLKMLWINLL